MINPGKDITSILTEIRSGKAARDKVIAQLYCNEKLRSGIQSMLFQKGGTKADFDHIFNTALLQFIKTVVKNEDIKISTSIHHYIMGIARYAWYAELRKKNKVQSDSIDNHFDISADSTPESLLIDFNQKELIQEILGQLGKNCKEVLLHWANGFRMSQIAKILGYKSEGMAKKKKHICFKELLGYLANNPHIKTILR